MRLYAALSDASMLLFDCTWPINLIPTGRNPVHLAQTGPGRELGMITRQPGKKFWVVAIQKGLDYILPTFQAIQATPAIES